MNNVCCCICAYNVFFCKPYYNIKKHFSCMVKYLNSKKVIKGIVLSSCLLMLTSPVFAESNNVPSDIVIEQHGGMDHITSNLLDDFNELKEIPILWTGPKLTKSKGVNQGPSGKETYYNLPMGGVIKTMRRMGNNDKYWVREDGCKMLGDYIMIAANLKVRPRGSLVETSLGTGIVCDTGGFAKRNPKQIDIAVNW